jgi:hypothetical protein
VALVAIPVYMLDAPSLTSASFEHTGTLPPLLPDRTVSVLRI